MRLKHAVPTLEELHAWMVKVRTEVENGSALAKALNYALNRWGVLSRYTQDGHLEIDNNGGALRSWGVRRQEELLVLRV